MNFSRNGDRSLTLRHQVSRGRPFAGDDAAQVLMQLGRLWGFLVNLENVDGEGGSAAKLRDAVPA